MRNEYDFSTAVKNPYIDQDKLPVIREMVLPNQLYECAVELGVDLSKTLAEALLDKFQS